MKNLLSGIAAVLVVFSAVVTWKYLSTSSELKSIQAENQRLETEIQALKKKVVARAANVEKQGPETRAASDKPQENKARLKGKAKTKTKPRIVSKRFITERKVEDIARFVVLTDEEREQLNKKFEQEYELKKQYDKEDAYQAEELERKLAEVDALEDIIGVVRAKQYETEKELARKARRAQRVQDEVFSLSRKLGLNEVQEQRLESSLFLVYEELGVIKEEMKKKHFKDEEKRLDYQAMLTLTKELKDKRNELINKEMQDVLSDEQINQLLELQATSQESPFKVWHD